MKRKPEPCCVCEQLIELSCAGLCDTCNDLFLEYEPLTIRRRMRAAIAAGNTPEHRRLLIILSDRLRVGGHLDCPRGPR